MDPEVARKFATAFAIAIGVIGPALGIGLIGKAALEGIARNPQAEGKIRSTGILFAAFVEALAIFALVVSFIIHFV